MEPDMELAMEPDTHEMVLVHRWFRREFALLPAMVRAVPDGDAHRTARVAAHGRELLQALHSHHRGEDEMLWPALLRRAEPQAALVHRMEQQHEQVAEQVAAVHELLGTWATTPTPPSRAALATAVETLSRSVDAHLDDEEQAVLPLVRRHISVREWEELGRHGRLSVPPRRRLSALGHILEDADPQERRRLLAQVPPPVRLVWRVMGQRLHRRELARLRTGLPSHG